MEKTSIRGYARLRGITEGAVRKAIKTGVIVKGFDTTEKKIIIKEADKEYGNVVSIKKINERIKESISQEDLEMYSGVKVMDIQLMPNDTEPEAKRKSTIIDGQLKLLKLKIQSGELVNKEDVYKELFAFGKEIRMNLQSIPSRIIDRIITLERHEAHKLLTESINEALSKLTTNENDK